MSTQAPSQKISMDKKYRTRDGRRARVLCVDHYSGLGRSVVAIIGPHANSNNKTETIVSLRPNGRGDYQIPQPYDLIEEKEKVTTHVVWSKAPNCTAFASAFHDEGAALYWKDRWVLENPGHTIWYEKIESEVP